MRPNLVYIHTHDTGRVVSPHGFAVPTPRVGALAREGVLFRKAFSAAPVCSPSRAALLNGNWPHENGMIGLAHRGSRLSDPTQHLAHVLTRSGWTSVLVGVQHVASPDELPALGYSVVPKVPSLKAADVAPVAAHWLRARNRSQPFFLSVGFDETHRPYPDPGPDDDPDYVGPPAGMPDTSAIRRDVAGFHTMLRAVDAAVGMVLDTLEETGAAEDTLVVFTTDHGLPWPNAKCTVTDAGTGVVLILRGPAGLSGGKVVDAMVSHLDIFPTFTDLAGLPRPRWLRGESLLPLVQGRTESVHAELFAEVTCHAASEPQRAIRTERWRYVRRFDGADLRVLANVDNGAAKSLFIDHGWGRRLPDAEALFDLVLDPDERINLIADPAFSDVAADLRVRLADWMRKTGDPLLDPDWTPPDHIGVVPRTSVDPSGDHERPPPNPGETP